MRRMILVVAVLAAAACNNEGGGVMREIERAEQEHAETVARALDEIGREVEEAPRTFPSGLELQFRRRGHDQSLALPTLNATVLVHYEGSLVDGGEVFDSSFARGEPAEFPLQAVVPGFSEAIAQMRPGDEVIATFPGSLGYGPEGRAPIPPNAALRFRIVLLAFQEPGGETVGDPG
ncbi:MAG: FKBP-type peptidyl-prolyl cis-trans isomerase [Phycisphaerales bacterium]|nr:FKBP-type peptidyl-prolyl cis-trans isomerase [Hyphomonadaceae bacterium]